MSSRGVEKFFESAIINLIFMPIFIVLQFIFVYIVVFFGINLAAAAVFEVIFILIKRKFEFKLSRVLVTAFGLNLAQIVAIIAVILWDLFAKQQSYLVSIARNFELFTSKAFIEQFLNSNINLTEEQGMHVTRLLVQAGIGIFIGFLFYAKMRLKKASTASISAPEKVVETKKTSKTKVKSKRR
ncbi:MAG: hypothetical protein QY314_02230 [Candidatus Dojkabacteria bacterium]|nr:MAG: hypothetical protein QY314_02230 [Candidatus Dojkabacteria bacterium]